MVPKSLSFYLLMQYKLEMEYFEKCIVRNREIVKVV